MSFTQTSRVWWDTSKPGSSTSALSDAVPDAAAPASDDQDTGTEGLERGKLVVCARSGFTVPESECIIDPYTGHLIWKHFVDKLHPADDDKGIR